MTTIHRGIIATTTALLLGLTVTACTGGGEPGGEAAGGTAPSTPAAASPTTPAPMPGPESESSSTPAPSAASASIPTDCTDVVDDATYAATMGSTPLNDPDLFPGQPKGRLQPTAPPAGADVDEVVRAATQLDCSWRDPRADVTSLSITVSGVDAETQQAYQAWLLDGDGLAPVVDDAGASFSCGPGYDGVLCQVVSEDPMYGVELATTVLMRDGLVVEVFQANYPTDDLMGALVARIWS